MLTFIQWLKDKGLDEAISGVSDPVAAAKRDVESKLKNLTTAQPDMTATNAVRTAMLDAAKANPAAIEKMQNQVNDPKGTAKTAAMKKKMKKGMKKK